MSRVLAALGRGAAAFLVAKGHIFPHVSWIWIWRKGIMFTVEVQLLLAQR